MYTPSILQFLAVALCASPIVSGLAIPASSEVETRGVGNLGGDLIARHHTEAQSEYSRSRFVTKGHDANILAVAAKAAKASTTTAASNTTTAATGKKAKGKGKGKVTAREVVVLDARDDLEDREAHHTEAQIAA